MELILHFFMNTELCMGWKSVQLQKYKLLYTTERDNRNYGCRLCVTMETNNAHTRLNWNTLGGIRKHCSLMQSEARPRATKASMGC